MKRFTDMIANLIVSNSSISKDDASFISYGIELFIISCGEIMAILLAALFIGNFMETLFFFIAFAPLRIYSGGFHAETRMGCFALLIVIYMCFTVVLGYIPESLILPIIIIESVFSLIIVILYAPVKNIKKSLSDKEIKKFRKISIVICIIEILFLIAVCITGYINFYILAFSLGQLSVAISMVAANIKSNILKGGDSIEKVC